MTERIKFRRIEILLRGLDYLKEKVRLLGRYPLTSSPPPFSMTERSTLRRTGVAAKPTLSNKHLYHTRCPFLLKNFFLVET